MFTVLYRNQALTQIEPFWGAAEVESMRWSVDGGCRTASMRAGVAKGMAAEMLGMAGTLVWIYDEQATAVWWGYMASVAVTIGGLAFEASMDMLANKLAVKYTYLEAGSPIGATGEARTTAWGYDAQSIALFGTKELIANANLVLTDTAALGRRDTELAIRRQLHAKASAGLGVPNDYAEVRIECRGLYDRLNWRYANWPAVAGPGYTTTSAAEQAVGAASTSSKAGQIITVGAGNINVVQVSIYARKQGTPADNLQAAIYAVDAALEPTGSALASWSLAGGSVGAALAWITQSVTEVELQASTQYMLVVSRSGAADASNYYLVGVNAALGYAGGALKILNGSNWVARSPDADMNFELRVNDLVESAYQVRDLVTNFGPSLITGVKLVSLSGVKLRSYRDGSTTALDEIEELLETGTADSRRLMCEINAERLFILRVEPAETVVSYYITEEGRQLGPGLTELPAHRPAIGVWCRLRGWLPVSGESAKLSDPTLQFVEEAEWSGGRVSFKFRG
jgi:hypothetical protein